MKKEPKHYIGKGAAVNNFDKIVGQNLNLETWAVSEKKARSNMEAQIKKDLKLPMSAKIKFVGTIKED